VAKTPLTKAMREEAVARMVADLAQPKVDAAKNEAAKHIRDLIIRNTPDVILGLDSEHSVYFTRVHNIVLELRHIHRSDFDEGRERVASLDSVQVPSHWKYESKWYDLVERMADEEFCPADELMAARGVVGAFDSAIADRDELRSTANSTLATFRTVEALTEQWPEAIKYITIPEKRMLPAVRCDELIAMVKVFKGEVQHA